MKNSSRFGRYAACVYRVNVKFTGPSYPQEEYITEGIIYTARSIPFTANECRKDIPDFLLPHFTTTFLMQYLVPGSPFVFIVIQNVYGFPLYVLNK